MDVFTGLLQPMHQRPGDPYPDGYRPKRILLKQEREREGVRVHLMEDDDLSPEERELPRAMSMRAHPQPTPAPAPPKAPREPKTGYGKRADDLYHPLQPGQQRRRRIKPGETRLPEWVEEEAAPALEVRRHVRPAGEMTYGHAVRLIHRDRDGEAVDQEELDQAIITVADAKRKGLVAA